jgi:predicted peroxiredoxin
MKPSEIIRKDAIRNRVDPDRLLASISKQLSDKNAIMLQSGDSVLILKKIGEGKVELHLFTVESAKTLMRSLKDFIDKIVGSGIKYVYGRADNKEILRMLKILGVNVEESDMKPYNWKAEVWEQ